MCPLSALVRYLLDTPLVLKVTQANGNWSLLHSVVCAAKGIAAWTLYWSSSMLEMLDVH